MRRASPQSWLTKEDWILNSLGSFDSHTNWSNTLEVGYVQVPNSAPVGPVGVAKTCKNYHNITWWVLLHCSSRGMFEYDPVDFHWNSFEKQLGLSISMRPSMMFWRACCKTRNCWPQPARNLIGPVGLTSFSQIGLVSMKVPKYSHYCWAGWTIQGKHRMLASSLQTFQKDDAQSPLGSGWVRLIHWCDTKMVKKELRCSTSKFAALSFWWLCILVILGKHWMPDTHAVTFSKDNETNSPRVWRRLDTFKTHIGKCCLCQAGRFVWHAAFRAHFCSQDVSKNHLSFPKQNPKKT